MKNFGYAAKDIDPEGFLRNPFAFINAAIRKTRSYQGVDELQTRSRLTYEDLFHEAVASLYLGLQSSQGMEREARTRQVFVGVVRQLGRYLRVSAGHKGDIQFSQFGSLDSDPIEFASPYSFEGEAMRSVWIDSILQHAERVLKSNRPRVQQGERDWKVFQLFAQGAGLEDILAECPWLSGREGVDGVITRCVLLIRADLGVDRNLPIRGLERSGQIKGERFDHKEYEKSYYERNQEHLRQRARENMRRLRAARKEQNS